MYANLEKLAAALEQFPLDFNEDDAEEIANMSHAKLFYGATRWCFVFDGDDYVYKISRNDDEEYHYDYCERELKNYEIAKTFDVEKLLLELRFVKELTNGIRIYAQSKFDFSHNDMDVNYNRILRKKVNSRYSPSIVRKSINHCLYNSIAFIWYARMIQLYGKKFARSFERFTKAAKVNDLHTANIGWKNDKPIILDYGGFLESSDCYTE